MTRAVVFAYHNVGVRCLKVLLARGVDVVLVVTHENDPGEAIWFESVAALCAELGIPSIAPADPLSPELFARVRSAKPDYLFSFYYRHLLPSDVLALAPCGAYNMHGSLLPKYRGRAPVNWAVLLGETETGATLHEMTGKPDAGAILAQESVPILPDDTAHEVFGKVTLAAEKALWTVLPALLAGTAPRLPNNIASGSYFGARRPEDGRIDWSQPAQAIYDLHRAVAPPYPGAWTTVGQTTYSIVKARLYPQCRQEAQHPGLAVIDGRIAGICGDGRVLHIHELQADGRPVSPAALQHALQSLWEEHEQ